MNSLVHAVLAVISAHPDWAAAVIFVTAFGESFVFLSLLFPGTTILIAAGALVGAGALDPASTIVAGAAGAIFGDAISYWIGQRFGQLIPAVWPFRNRPYLLLAAIRFFERYGWTSVFIGRFFGPLRAVIPLAAGLMRMPAVPFYVANCFSAVIWAPALVLSGALLSRALSVGRTVEDKIFLIALAVAIMVALAHWARRIFRVRP